jgi:hypothetical protein
MQCRQLQAGRRRVHGCVRDFAAGRRLRKVGSTSGSSSLNLSAGPATNLKDARAGPASWGDRAVLTASALRPDLGNIAEIMLWALHSSNSFKDGELLMCAASVAARAVE